MDLKEVEKIVVRKFAEFYPHLEFNVEYSKDKSFIEFRFDKVHMEGLGVESYIALACGFGNIAMFTMLFPKLKKNLTTLNAVNDFNLNVTTFKAFLDPGGYLMLENAFPIYSEREFLDQALEFMTRVNNLVNNRFLKKVLENRMEA